MVAEAASYHGSSSDMPDISDRHQCARDTALGIERGHWLLISSQHRDLSYSFFIGEKVTWV